MDIYGIAQSLARNGASNDFCAKYSADDLNFLIDTVKKAIYTNDKEARATALSFLNGLGDGLGASYYMASQHLHE